MTDKEHRGNRFQEVFDEARTQLMGRSKLIDTLLPPLLFLLVNWIWGLIPALVTAVSAALLVTVYRLARGEKLGFALSGLGVVFLAALFAWWMSRAGSFFLPGIITNLALVIGMTASLVVRKPLMALASHLSRGWPQDWYWHPLVRPAYMEVTLAWVIILAIRLAIQIYLYQNEQVNALGVFQILTGTPATIGLLVLSYLYGIWRLRQLKGPSVSEFRNDEPPPWKGQQRGF